MFNDINLNLYKVFYDVVKYGSFSKAAEFTYTTQSSISKSIKKLEEQLGIKLFYSSRLTKHWPYTFLHNKKAHIFGGSNSNSVYKYHYIINETIYRNKGE